MEDIINDVASWGFETIKALYVWWFGVLEAIGMWVFGHLKTFGKWLDPLAWGVFLDLLNSDVGRGIDRFIDSLPLGIQFGLLLSSIGLFLRICLNVSVAALAISVVIIPTVTILAPLFAMYIGVRIIVALISEVIAFKRMGSKPTTDVQDLPMAHKEPEGA